MVKRILYGFLAEGSGHMSRARAVIPRLREQGAEVDVLISGAPGIEDRVYGSDVFKGAELRRGFSLSKKDGHVNLFKTTFNFFASMPGRINQSLSLDLDSYDTVISDLEQITAWSAYLKGKPSIAFSHQASFSRKVPKSHVTMNLFPLIAPAKVQIGLHYDSFGQPNIVPPIIQEFKEGDFLEDKITVYLPHEKLDEVLDVLKPFKEHSFFVYHHDVKEQEQPFSHVILEPPSREEFKKDFSESVGVITNAGFMTTSEALHMGKKLLVCPQKGQPEQSSNVLALQRMKVGGVMKRLDQEKIGSWLRDKSPVARIQYPDVADAFARFVVEGNYSQEAIKQMTNSLWQDTHRSNNHLDLG